MRYQTTLLERVRHGDVASFEAIFEEYHQRICRYLCSLVGDLDLAEDLAQQTFLKAYRALGRGSPPENLKAWLYAIATNTALSALRRRKLMQRLSFYPQAERIRSPGPDQETRLGQQELLRQTLETLPPADSACLLLRLQQGLSYGELAEIMGTSIPAARMRLSRARAAFREAYLQLSGEEKR
ncbi:MAG: sigma-70 family RNA polymerase sigma factor [Anaerolineae bacterium]|nr:sigma-70 family RNA polymerase sigma factor [Anaerolineae bacterium]